jgi:hypothetical protein
VRLPTQLLQSRLDNPVGKTIFLYYALIERILDGLLTLVELNPKRVFMFLGPANVSIYPDSEYLDSRLYLGACIRGMLDVGGEQGD